MKRALYVSLILALLSSTSVAAQQTNRPIRTLKQFDMISTLAAAPANAWDAFIAMLQDAQRRLTPQKGNPTINGVLTEPIGAEEPPPPPPSSNP